MTFYWCLKSVTLLSSFFLASDSSLKVSCQPEKPFATSTTQSTRLPKRLKILTYNILQAHRGIDPIVELIREQQPDIIFLQEVLRPDGTANGIDQAATIAKRLGGLHVVSATSLGAPNKRAWDPVILTRFPIRNAQLIHGLHDTRVFAVLATLGGTDRPLHLLSVHTQSTHRLTMDHVLSSSLVRMEQVTELLQFVKGLDGDVIVAGDFNATNWMPEYLAVTRQWTDFGLITKDKKLSYPSDAPKARIDYVFGRGRFEAVSYRVLDSRASDHRPVVVVLKRNQRTGGPNKKKRSP